MSLELLKRKEIAEMFGVTPNTVRIWERQGLIKPFCRLNGRPRHCKNQLSQLFNQVGGTGKMEFILTTRNRRQWCRN